MVSRLVASCCGRVDVVSGPTFAASARHRFTKGCESPTQISAPYKCTYSVRNTIDDNQDTLTINGLVDTVHAAGGNVSSGNVFSSLRFEIAAGSPDVHRRHRRRLSREPVHRGLVLHAPGRLAPQRAVVLVLHGAGRGLRSARATSSPTAGLDLARPVQRPGRHREHELQPESAGCRRGARCRSIRSFRRRRRPTSTTRRTHAVTAVAAGTTVHDFVTVSGGSREPAARPAT